MSLLKGKIAAIVFLLAIVFIPLGFNYAVYHQIKQKMPFEAGGEFSPGWFGTSFYIKKAKFKWQDRVELLPGDLKISYDFFTIFRSQVRLKFEGKKLNIELLGDWAKMQNASRVQLETFYADLGIHEGEIKELYGIEALGPQFRFSILPSK